MHRRAGWAVVAALCAVSFAGQKSAEAEPLERLGVVVSLTLNVDDAEVASAVKDLADVMRKKLFLEVVYGPDVASKLPANVPADCSAQPQCIEEVASKLEADFLLFVTFVGVGEEVNVESVWAERKSKRNETGPVVSVSGKQYRQAFDLKARDLLPPAKQRPDTGTGNGTGNGNNIVSPGPEKRGRHLDTTGYITGSLAVVMLAGAGGLGLKNRSDHDSFENDMNTTVDPDSLKRNNLIADGLLVGGVILGTVTLVRFLTSGGSADERASGLGVAPTNGGFGVSYAGSF